MSKRLLIILNILLLLVSCKPKESILKQGSAGRLSDSEIEGLLLKRYNEIETFKLGRINFALNVNDEELKSGGTIGIIKDSVIVVSLVPALGFEISRIFCYKDKILVLDRIEKTYFYTSLQRNMEKYKIIAKYDDIEALLTGRAFIYGNQINGAKLKKNMERGSEEIRLRYNILERETTRTDQEIRITESELLIKDNRISDIKENTNIRLGYENFIRIEGFMMPQKVILEVTSKDNNLRLMIEIGSILFNETINADNTIPSKYEEAIIDY